VVAERAVKATWCRQDVLARAWSTFTFIAKRDISVQAINNKRQSNCWYVNAFLDRGTTRNIVEDHIKQHAKESRKFIYTILLVPRVSTLISQILEEEGVLGDVTVSSYNLQFIPLASDVISLENDKALKEIWVVSNHFPLVLGLVNKFHSAGWR
jgi:hypothetical protein